jgi:hypothetical protein
MIRPMAKQKGTTDRGNMFVLSQWAPNVIQLTLQNGDYVISETLENLRSESEMLERRTTLEDEFLQWITTETENGNETTQPLLHATGSISPSGEGMGATGSAGI